MNAGMWLGIGIPVIVAAVITWAIRYTTVGPNEVLIVSGRQRALIDAAGRKHVVGYRMVRGGGTFVIPIKEQARRLSLELMTVEVRTPEVYTLHGVPVMADAVVQVKVQGDEASIAIAAEEFLSRSREDMTKMIQQTLDGHLRAVLGMKSIEDIYGKRNATAQQLRDAASSDLAKMGIEIVSATIRNIADSQGYLEALGRSRIAEVKRDAVKGESEAGQEAELARFEAQTKIEESRRDFEVHKAKYQAEIQSSQAESDLAYDLSKFKATQQVRAEEVQVQIVEKEKTIELEGKEVFRKEKALEAEVKREAEAERYRIETLADGERYRLEAEGQGAAEAIKARGVADADAMSRKADAWSQYGEAAITEMMVNMLPELAHAVAEPLSKTEKIVVIGNNGSSTGVEKITQDVTHIMAQLPPVLESLTGIKLEELVRRIADGKPSEQQNTTTTKVGA